MGKKELESRYQHKYPGYKQVDLLNSKFRDRNLPGLKDTLPTMTSETFRKTKEDLGPVKANGKAIRNWDQCDETLGPRWTQSHWEHNTESFADCQNQHCP